MTAEQRENAAASAALTAGEAADTGHRTDVQAMHRENTGSGVDVSDTGRGPSDSAVGWFGEDRGSSGVSPQPKHSPNVSDPLDNSQSQP